MNDIRADVAALLRELPTDPWGDVSTSVYETARLVSLAPWLKGHRARLEFLYRTQEPDGSWGGPGGYALVPTLSATEALLTCLRRTDQQGARLVRALDRGLAALRKPCGPVPDTIAVEVVVPALVAAINQHLDDLVWPAAGRVRLPEGLDPAVPAAVAARIASGAPVPPTWPSSLEALGPDVPPDAVEPCDGTVGCSPAATAAWLALQPARSPAGDGAARHLDALQARYGGPVPGVTPITYFERAWVLASLSGTTIRGVTEAPVAPGVLDSLATSLGSAGAPAAPGLPPDCDDSAVVLTALDRYGRHRSPDCLLAYRAGGHFRCFATERTPSTSTNAHALETLSRGHPADRQRFEPVARATAAWLLDAQHADGCWWDKWHASPYYATVSCVQALAAWRDQPAERAIAKAADFVLATQRDDGSWGRWGGTVEETAYAIQILVSAPLDRTAGAAITGGAAFLRAAPAHGPHRPLWHAKDLYAPGRVIRAARLAALAAAVSVVGAEPAPSAPGARAAAWPPPAARSVPARRSPAGSGAAARPR